MDLDIQRTEQLNEPTYVDFTKVYLRKVNKTRKMFGNVTLNIPIDNTFYAYGQLFRKQGGEYRLMPFRIPKMALCDFVSDEKLYYPELCEYSDFEDPFKCPLQAKAYAFRGYSPSLKNAPLSMVQSGDLAGEVTVEKEGTIYFRARVYFSIVRI